MARLPLDAPGAFAQLVASAIRREMGDRRMSGRALAREIEKSEKYVRERINGVFEFTLNDIDAFCTFIGLAPEVFIARIESDPSLYRPSNVTPIGGSDVSGMTEDQLLELPHAANRDESAGESEPDLP
jgi:hypothetical protein